MVWPLSFALLISIHALREEGDGEVWKARPRRSKFLSTPSARRATQVRPSIKLGGLNFYPRPPRGGRPRPSWSKRWRSGYFYPRPPRGGRPATARLLRTATTNFYPRPPRGGRLCGGKPQNRCVSISIHALREEGDCIGRLPHRHNRNFYPRPPRGGRPGDLHPVPYWQDISIHAPRVVGDCRKR